MSGPLIPYPMPDPPEGTEWKNEVPRWSPPPGAFGKCRKPDCMRKVTQNVAYCCHACAKADESGYELEPHDPSLHWILCHSAGCEARRAERGEYHPMGVWP